MIHCAISISSYKTLHLFMKNLIVFEVAKILDVAVAGAATHDIVLRCTADRPGGQDA